MREGDARPLLRMQAGRRQQLAQHLEADSSFETRQVRAQAEVDSVAERDVVVRLAARVEALGLVEVARVAVGGGVHHHQPVAPGQLLAAEFHVRRRNTGEAVHRRFEP